MEQTFGYDSPYWTNKEGYAVEDGHKGLTEKESKLAPYWNTPFKKICLGMTVNGDRKWMVLDYEASSLYSGDRRWKGQVHIRFHLSFFSRLLLFFCEYYLKKNFFLFKRPVLHQSRNVFLDLTALQLKEALQLNH